MNLDDLLEEFKDDKSLMSKGGGAVKTALSSGQNKTAANDDGWGNFGASATQHKIGGAVS